MTPRTSPQISRLDYCQYLLSSQINYTLTYFADHSPGFSHDAVNRLLSKDRMTPHLIWENVKGDVKQVTGGYLVFDDTVIDKRYAQQIELVRRQYSGNAHGVIRGIGVVTCVYVNPATDAFWIIDYRIYDPDGDGKSKLDHVHDMLTTAVYQKCLLFRGVLMDTWYAARPLMLYIEQLQKVYYCPLKDNRHVDDSDGVQSYQRVDTLTWSEAEQTHGKLVKIKDFPKGHRVKLFRLVLSTQRTDFVATNDLTQNDTQATHLIGGLRWKIEQFHRETKQLTGLEGCQCRLARIVRNHIACAILVWVRLKHLAALSTQTVYQLKQGLLSDYLRHQLKNPSIHMTLA
ncbi:MAG: transposase [Chloroflexi bacterium]|nr:transposase [Chloroflexota bacterium]